MTVNEAIALIENLLDLGCLNKVQDLIVRYAWEGKSYQNLADDWGYTHGHIKDSGYKLWKDLTLAIGSKEKVTKNNIQLVLMRYHPTKPDNPNSQDWGDAMDVSVFYERTEELATLERWIVSDRCRFITLYGMGGIGKTALAIKLAKQLPGYQYLFWRSLRNSPPISSLLSELLIFFSINPISTSISQQILQIVNHLRQCSCLLILDNVESVLQSGDYTGKYREGYEGYGQLFRCLADVSHQSTVLLTTREVPKGLMVKEGVNQPIRSLQIKGLSVVATEKLFHAKGVFSAKEVDWKNLRDRYGGNPLFLIIVAATIQDLFESNISDFLSFLSCETLACNEVYYLISQQLNRLSEIEKGIILSLFNYQEPISFSKLQQSLPKLHSGQVVDAIASLSRQSLIERVDPSSQWTVQSTIRAFMRESLFQDRAS